MRHAASRAVVSGRSGALTDGDDRANATKVREPRTSASQCFVGGADVQNGCPGPESLPMWTGVSTLALAGGPRARRGPVATLRWRLGAPERVPGWERNGCPS